MIRRFLEGSVEWVRLRWRTCLAWSVVAFTLSDLSTWHLLFVSTVLALGFSSDIWHAESQGYRRGAGDLSTIAHRAFRWGYREAQRDITKAALERRRRTEERAEAERRRRTLEPLPEERAR